MPTKVVGSDASLLFDKTLRKKGNKKELKLKVEELKNKNTMTSQRILQFFNSSLDCNLNCLIDVQGHLIVYWSIATCNAPNTEQQKQQSSTIKYPRTPQGKDHIVCV